MGHLSDSQQPHLNRIPSKNLGKGLRHLAAVRILNANEEELDLCTMILHGPPQCHDHGDPTSHPFIHVPSLKLTLGADIVSRWKGRNVLTS